jgi:hypothetical protein
MLAYVTNKVYDAGGNNNGQLDRGETADLTVFLKNIGGQNFTTLASTLSSTDPYITISDNSGNFGSILIDSTKENAADKYRVTVSASAPMNHLIPFRVIATQGSFNDTFDFGIRTAKLCPMDTGYYYTYYNGGPFQQCPTYSWYAIDTTQTLHPGTSMGMESDDQTMTVALPFTFKYYGVNYTQVSVCTNGWIALGSSTWTSYYNYPLPSTSAPPTTVFGLWDDLYPGAAGPGDIYYYNDAANHRFVIEFFRVDHLSPTGYPETFQFLLYQPGYPNTPTGDGEVIVQYNTVRYLSSSTIGIQNMSQNVGIQYYYNGTYDPMAVPVTNGRALKYTTDPPTTVGIAEHKSAARNPVTLTVTPNPSNGKVVFGIGHSVPSKFDEDSRLSDGTKSLELNIYDLSGRVVYSSTLSPSLSALCWDATDRSGERLPAGVYFVKLTADEGETIRKLVLTR